MPHRFDPNPIEPDPLPAGAGAGGRHNRGRGGSRLPVTTAGLLDPEPIPPAKQGVAEIVREALRRFRERYG